MFKNRCRVRFFSSFKTAFFLLSLLFLINGQSAVAQRTWTGTTPSASPEPPEIRYAHGVAYHSAGGNNVLVLFGGHHKVGSVNEDRNDTWELVWDGESCYWVRTLGQNPSSGTNQPRQRRLFAMSEGPAGYPVIYGGVRTIGGSDFLFDDVWTSNADTNAWTKATFMSLPGGSLPNLRRSHAMAFDSTRNAIVGFGGYETGYLGDTFEIRKAGLSWQWVPKSISGPSARTGHKMVFDKARNKIVLFGGWDDSQEFGDTWEYDSTTGWQEVDDSGPSPRAWVSLAYDEVRGKVVLFGGQTKSGTYFNDTWEWDGTSWTKINDDFPELLSPEGRAYGAAAWENHKNQMVIFGGRTSNNKQLNDNWAYYYKADGTPFWKELSNPQASARYGHSLAYHSDSGRTVLFGGYYWNGSDYEDRNDTWELAWDDGNLRWEKILPHNASPGTHQPLPRRMAAMAEGPNGLIYLYGGFRDVGTTPQTLDDVWSYDADTDLWTQLSVTPQPDKRRAHALAYDTDRGIIVMFGGYNTTYMADTRELRKVGMTYQLADLGIPGPPARMAHQMAYDKVRHKVVLFGGWDLTTTFGDTWEYTPGVGWAQVCDTGPAPRAAHVMAYDEKSGRVVLFGGKNKTGTKFNDTWEWDGSSWRRIDDLVPDLQPPSVRYWSAAAFDSVKNKLILFGGQNDITKFSEIWTYSADNYPPQISHIPVTTGVEGVPITIQANIYDPDGDPLSVTLYYRIADSGGFSSAPMNQGAGSLFSADIPTGFVTMAGVDYYIEADDGTETAQHFAYCGIPHRINITPALASLTVTIDPDKPDFSPNPRAEGQWSIDGGTTWHPSGYTLTGLVAGTEVTITLFDLNYWDEPATPLTLLPGPNIATVNYTPHPASLTVTIDPDDPEISPNPRYDGRWSIDGVNWNSSGYTLNGLTPFTNVTITLLDLSCWDEPPTSQPLMPGPNSATVSYTHLPATLTVTINPDEPGFSPNPRAEGQWSIDGGTTWHPSGHTLTGLNACEMVNVTLSNLKCWETPIIIERFLEPGDNQWQYSYIHKDASLTVTIDPDQTNYSPNPRADGRWSIDGGTTWHPSGHTETGLYACGEVTITYNQLAGWSKPPDNPFHLGEGGNNVTGTYTRDTGTLKVIIDQGGGNGSFSIAGPSDFTPVTGQTTNYSASAPTGSYTVIFTQETGYHLEITATSFTVTPPSASGDLAKDAVETVTGTYSKVGNLQVFIDPEGVRTEGAAWRRVGTTQWHPHAYIEADVLVGEHTVEFKDAYDVNCWEAPMDATVTIAQDTLTQLTKNYWEVGNIRVTLCSFFSEEGGKWRQIHTDKPSSEWRDSGYVDLSEVVFKPYEIEYSQPNANWIKLPNDLVTLIQCETVDHVQELPPGSLKVYIYPVQARTAGALWSYDSKPDWWEHAVKVDNVNSGHHNVRFKSILGWTKPAPIPVKVYPTKPTEAQGTYIKNTASANSDYNGDGVSDLSYFRPGDGTWHVSGQSTVVFGGEDDVPVPGDYNGDGITERAFFRGNDGSWNIYGSAPVTFGQEGDIPAPADYDGDGTTDIAVFRPSEGKWYFHSGAAPISFGWPYDAPLPADYNGDGHDDVALFRPSDNTWYIYGQGSVLYGQEGDIPAPADYNGDGFTDIAVFRPSDGVWHIRGIGDFEFGREGDIPTPGDYDGDGIADIAVFRQSEGKWYVYNMFEQTFGQEGDIPLVRGK